MHQIVLRQNGNIGNRMIQYAFALNLAQHIAPCELVGVDLPEWGLSDAPTTARLFAAELLVTDTSFHSLDALVEQISHHSNLRIELRGVFQNIDILPSREVVSQLFPASGKHLYDFGPNDILINIRAGEILGGVPWYPIVPLQFYIDLVAQTGFDPVFVGQVGPSLYVDKIRQAFPLARFISTGVPMDDFELVRSAENICIAVSTFSWLAAWLSNSKQVFYPVLGCLHPGLSKCYVEGVAPTNLVPVNDDRYRFFLFPLTYGLEQHAMLEQHRKWNGEWREVPASHIKFIRDYAPILPLARVMGGIDPFWYVHMHLVAAWEIAEGLYASPYHHYAGIGRARGYQPAPPLTIATGRNVAQGKTAMQSSLSEWSSVMTQGIDAASAVSGHFPEDCAFHTALEERPWWLCDLGEIHMVEVINIYNRNSNSLEIRKRALPLLVEGSLDGKEFTEIKLFDEYHDFGSRDLGPLPLQMTFVNGIAIRYLRITILSRGTFFHLSQVEVFGFRDAIISTFDRLPPRDSSNIGVKGIATQSSLSVWSSGSLQEDASRALHALPGIDYSFHTANEHRPWWQVDLGHQHSIKEVRLFNRQGHRAISARLSQFQFQVSDDSLIWSVVHNQRDPLSVGGVIGGPLIWEPETETISRYFRVQLNFHGILHFNRIEIYGCLSVGMLVA